MDNTTVRDASLLGDRSRHRLEPLVSDAIAAGGGVVVAFGVLLLGINQYANSSSRWPGALLFVALAVVAYFALGFVPRSVTPSCIAAFAVAVPGCFGFMFFPKVHQFGDLRPFFILTIGVWLAAWIVPRTTARPLFVALALLLFWLWMIGEVAGTSSYSAAPVPSPPYMTLTDFSHRAAQVSIDQLDHSDPLYPIAEQCASGDNSACDDLYTQATPSTDFERFGRTCGGRQPDAAGGDCDFSSASPNPSPLPRFGNITPTRSNDKTTEIGVVSTIIGVLYLGVMMLLDQRRYLGLATAFVLPGIVALLSGVSALGDRSRHLWVGGLLAMVAGLLIGVLGERGGRRFTAWYGGYTASIGVLLVGLDTANSGASIGHTSSSGHAKLIGPALIIILFGVALVVVASFVAQLMQSGRRRFPGDPGDPGGGVPMMVGAGGPTSPMAPVPAAPGESVAPSQPAPWATPPPPTPSTPPATPPWSRPPEPPAEPGWPPRPPTGPE